MTAHQPRFRLTDPGAFIAALPAVLGFVPEQSLVVVSLEGGELGAVMRTDLSEELPCQIEHLAEMARSSGADAAVAVIVDKEGALCAICASDHAMLCTELAGVLGEFDIVLLAGFVVDRIGAGGHWQSLDGSGEEGQVHDPDCSPLAAAAVLDGRRLYGRREELEAVIAPADEARAARLSGLITKRIKRRGDGSQRNPDLRARREVRAAMAAAARVGGGAELSDGEIAGLAASLSDVVVRDTLYALAVGSDAGQSETLWALLARTLPESWRAEALVLLAFSAYTRGDGPLAGLALDAALTADPGHRMAGMLDTALRAGMRPEQIRELAGTGYRLAKKLGVRLPPRRRFNRPAV